MRRLLLFLVILMAIPMMVYAQEDGRVVHTVQRGETLRRISDFYNVPLQDIVNLNGITNPNHIYVGQRLEIKPATVASTPEIETTEPLEAVSDVNEADVSPVGTAVEQLLQATTAEVEAEPTMISYTVTRGDSLGVIAERFGVDWRTIARINQIQNVNTIYPGQKLQIPTDDDSYIDIFAEDYFIPEPTITEGRQIIVSLSASRVYAFEDGELVKTVLVSLGKANTPTIPGDFEIYYRVRVQTMTGPGYSTPNVEWVLYYHQGYALHGAWWHENWGYPMSAGCVNMPNEDARWFWENFGDIGTPVSVIY
jgi:LysM repeat protein